MIDYQAKLNWAKLGPLHPHCGIGQLVLWDPVGTIVEGITFVDFGSFSLGVTCRSKLSPLVSNKPSFNGFPCSTG